MDSARVARSGRCLAIVPIGLGDRQAPAGIPAFRVLRGVPLLQRAVTALVRSGAVSRVVVPAPTSACQAVSTLLDEVAADAGVPVEVRALPGPGNGHRIRAAMRAVSTSGGPSPGGTGPGTGTGLVLVHDPLHALAPASLVRSVVTALEQASAEVTSAVPVRLVTDTLKWVDEDDVVHSTVDRDGYRMVYSPQVHRWGDLDAALGGATDDELRDDGAAALPRLMLRCGGQVVSVAAPPDVFRIATDEDVVMADAMLHVRADQDEESVLIT